jgi:RHS repeat-associated protein
VRSGNATGDPTKRYSANLGHQADDESDLIYMRARYYEPATGRFVSEDPGYDGLNWFVYCGNSPVSHVDSSGKKIEPMEVQLACLGLLLGFFSGLFTDLQMGTLSTASIKTAVWGSIYGFVGTVAGEYVWEALGMRASGSIKPKWRITLSIGGGIAGMAILWIGYRGGQIMFELFAIYWWERSDGAVSL